MSIFNFTFYIKNYIFLKNIVWKKAVSAILFYLQFSDVAGYLNRCNDAPKHDIHKCNNYNLIEIYVNSDGLLDIDVIEVRSFRNKAKACGKGFFFHPVEVTESMYVGNIFWIMCISKI